MEKTECVWKMGTECNGEISMRGTFSKQIDILVCDGHYKEHCVLMALHSKHKIEIETLLEMPADEREQKLCELESLKSVSDIQEELVKYA